MPTSFVPNFRPLFNTQSQKSLPLLILGIVIYNIVLLDPQQQHVNAIEFKHCYMIWGLSDDLGYSHALNLARLKTQDTLQARWGHLHNFTVQSVENVFYQPTSYRYSLVEDLVRQGCNVIFGSGAAGWSEQYNSTWAVKYPNVTFVQMLAPLADQPGNFIMINSLPEKINYEIAAAAAVHADKCIGFIGAYEDHQQVWSQAMGTVMGVRRIKPSLPVHIVTMNNFFRPDAEVVVSQLLHDRHGCEVILRRTDPATSDKAMAQTNGATMTVAPHIDMRLFVGDSAFSSAVVDWSVVFVPIIEAAVNATLVNGTGNLHGRFPYPFISGLEDNGFFTAAPFSPRVSDAAKQAAKDAHDYVAGFGGSSIICNPLTLRDGSSIPTRPGENCMDPAAVAPKYINFDNAVFHDAFVDGAESCTGGQYYTYSDDLVPTCHLCAVNTYRPPEQVRASENACRPCPSGRETRGELGATQCLEPVDHSVTIAVSVAAGVIVLIAALAAIIAVMRVKGDARDNRCAPKDSQKPITILFTDIQSSTRLWASSPVVMSEAVEAHHRLIREQIARFKGYEVKTIGDAFMIVHENPVEAVEMALAIQRSLFNHNWGSDEIDAIYHEMFLEEQEARQEQEPKEHAPLPQVPITPAVQDGMHTPQNEEPTQTPQNNNQAASKYNSFDSFDRSAWNGLRVRIGVHSGLCSGQEDEVTKGWDYYGTPVNTAARTEAVGHGGQIVITDAVLNAALEIKNSSVGSYPFTSCTGHAEGEHVLRGLENKIGLHTLSPVDIPAFAKRKYPPLRVDINADHAEDDDPAAAEKMTAGGSSAGSSLKSLSAGLTPEVLVERLNPQAKNSPVVTDGILDRYRTLDTIFSSLPQKEKKQTIDRLAACWSLPGSKGRMNGMHLFARKLGANAPEIMLLAIKVHQISMVKDRVVHQQHQSNRPEDCRSVQ